MASKTTKPAPSDPSPSATTAAQPSIAKPPVISNDVAFVKMEQKLKTAMTQIAELSAEKEMLEHA